MDVIIWLQSAVIIFVVLYLFTGAISLTCLENRVSAFDVFIEGEQKRHAGFKKENTKLMAETYQRRTMGPYIPLEIMQQYSFSKVFTVEETINALVEHSGCDLITQPGTRSKTVLVKKTPTKKARSTRK